MTSKFPPRAYLKRWAEVWRRHWPQTYLGFPVAGPASREEGRPPAQARERGVSLLIAVMTIVVMVGFVSDMIITSSVEVELALSSRDRVKSEYLAKSGFNLGLFVLTISQLKDIMMANPPLSQAPHDGLDSPWNVFKSLPPIGASTVDLILASAKSENDPFKLKGLMNEKVAEQMRFFEDQFSLRITDERSRINVNDCSEGACREVLAQLTRLFSCPAEKAFLDSKDLTAEELAYRIKDFVSSKGSVSSQSGLSEANYTDAIPPYGLKALPLDSIDELKLIPGWDEDVHAVFAPYLTVYPFKQKSNSKVHRLNINTVAPELLGCLVPEAKHQGCAEKFAQSSHKMQTDETSLADDAAKIKEKLGELACYTPPPAEEAEGVNPVDWFDVYSNVFRIEVTAETGNQERRLEVVIQRFDPGEEKNDNIMKKLKDQRPYRILYWKLI